MHLFDCISMVWVLSFGLSLTAPVEDSAPRRIISCQYSHAEFSLHCTVDWIRLDLHSLLPLASVSLKPTEFKWICRRSSPCSLSSLLSTAQRKGPNEISSTTECPDSAGLPQTETGMHENRQTQQWMVAPASNSQLYQCHPRAGLNLCSLNRISANREHLTKQALIPRDESKVSEQTLFCVCCCNLLNQLIQTRQKFCCFSSSFISCGVHEDYELITL